MKQGIFDRLLLSGVRSGQLPARSQEAKNWFRNKSSAVKATAKNILSETKRGKANIEIGRMYFFSYEAENKDTLPFWDAFPLIFPFAETQKHFYGINLHYLPPQYRAKLMDALYDLVNNDKYDKTTKLKLSYQVLNSVSKLSYFKPCVKMYLKSNVRSSFIQVEASEWDIALMLPIAQWRNASRQKVYSTVTKSL